MEFDETLLSNVTDLSFISLSSCIGCGTVFFFLLWIWKKKRKKKQWEIITNFFFFYLNIVYILSHLLWERSFPAGDDEIGHTGHVFRGIKNSFQNLCHDTKTIFFESEFQYFLLNYGSQRRNGGQTVLRYSPEFKTCEYPSLKPQHPPPSTTCHLFTYLMTSNTNINLSMCTQMCACYIHE